MLQQGVVDMSEVTQSTAKKTPVPVSRHDHMAQITATQAVNLLDKQSAPMPMLQRLNSDGYILNKQYIDTIFDSIGIDVKRIAINYCKTSLWNLCVKLSTYLSRRQSR